MHIGHIFDRFGEIGVGTWCRKAESTVHKANGVCSHMDSDSLFILKDISINCVLTPLFPSSGQNEREDGLLWSSSVAKVRFDQFLSLSLSLSSLYPPYLASSSSNCLYYHYHYCCKNCCSSVIISIIILTNNTIYH